MIVYQIHHEEYGWITYRTLDDAMQEIRDTVDAMSLCPGSVDLEIRVVEMTQEEMDALPEIEM